MAEEKSKFTTITEGSITMKYPADEESTVFYNPVQVQNRDLSILMLTLYSERRAVQKAVFQKKKELRQQNQGKQGSERMSGDEIKKQLEEYQASLNPTQVALEQKEEGITILDALAASGLRSMRYWKEIPGVKHVTINDLELAAVERAHTNIEGNGLMDVVVKENPPPTTSTDPKPWQRPRGIQVQNGDAKIEMYMSQRPQTMHTMPNPTLANLKPQWDVIDLDPYGSAAPFLDAAVQAIESGGMLAVTCTDMAALGGSHPETCYGRYASMPIPNARYLQEVALRILLCSLATTAAKYGRTIKPILSVGMNFYIRVFVEVKDDKAGVSLIDLAIL
jgi:tRNA (guanine26-N2/guanine27-N2)-dimethyltransferase